MEPKNRASLGSLSDVWALGEFALGVRGEDGPLSPVQPPAIEKDPPGRPRACLGVRARTRWRRGARSRDEEERGAVAGATGGGGGGRGAGRDQPSHGALLGGGDGD